MRSWREVLLVLFSILISYLIPEIAYRIYQHQSLPQKLYALITASSDRGADGKVGSRKIYVFDQYTGYRYAANNEGRRGSPWNNYWKTNSHGHVSSSEYPRKKPASEFRIAVIGDSFTANINNNVKWTEVAEVSLNSSAEWRARVGGKFTRVINFGVDGTGFIQFAAMVRHYAVEYEPDIIVVNFISDDILRRLRYPEPPASVDRAEGDREKAIRNGIQAHYLDQIHWFRIYPELFAATAGKYFNMAPDLPLDASVILTKPHYFDRREALAVSAKAIDDMLSVDQDILFLNVPTYHELVNEVVPSFRKLVGELREMAPKANIVSMAPYMDKLLDGKRLKDRPDLSGMTLHQIAALQDDQKLEVYRWFFLPEDVHYTDYGTTLYGRQVANYMIEHSDVGKPQH